MKKFIKIDPITGLIVSTGITMTLEEDCLEVPSSTNLSSLEGHKLEDGIFIKLPACAVVSVVGSSVTISGVTTNVSLKVVDCSSGEALLDTVISSDEELLLNDIGEYQLELRPLNSIALPVLRKFLIE